MAIVASRSGTFTMNQSGLSDTPSTPKISDSAEALLSASGPQQPPRVRLRELVALSLMVVLADFTLFRAAGFAGYAAFMIGATVLLVFGTARFSERKGTLAAGVLIVGPMLAALAIRLLWCGSWLGVVCGSVLIVCFAMALNGRVPYLSHAIEFAAQTIPAGHRGLNLYFRLLSGVKVRRSEGGRMSLLLPLVICSAFALLFVLANPDLLGAISSSLSVVFSAAQEWLVDFSPQLTEVLFWGCTIWITVGLLRPQSALDGDVTEEREQTPYGPAPMYEAFRNSLIAVVGLFAVYLVFEFQTLWFREFPKGFHYSGYAHEGAAWLTVALGLATLLLSIIFRGAVLSDDRLPGLRRLAWLWSLENVLLAAAVYHRLFIYVGFNGMTRMRVIGLLGMTSVLVGFLLVVWKIVNSHDFHWLIRRQLWTVGVAAYLYAVLPVDSLVMTYNVDRILSGDSAPSVQISVHPTSAEGYLQLIPLADSDNEIIRDGVRALLARRQEIGHRESKQRTAGGWSAIQIAEDQLIDQLKSNESRWSGFANATARKEAAERFHKYAYQWF